jgi:adenosine deaminase
MPSSRDPHETELSLDMQPDDERALLARRVPKAEMHMHHMGSLAPSELARLQKLKTGRAPSGREMIEAYDNRGVGKFFDDLDRAVRLWGDHATLVAGAVHMISAAYNRGVRHLELLCTPDLHRQELGMSPETLLRGIGEAFSVVGDELGMTGGIVVELHRFDGGPAALALVEETVGLRESGVPIVGYGNDGDHRTVPFEELAPAYERARAEGFKLTGHADIFEDVGVALDLGLDRIDHGWMATDDPATVARLAASGTPLTFTPGGYSLGGLDGDLSYQEAWTVLSDAGVVLAIGTDDPELHHTDIARDYDLMARKLDWTMVEVGEAAKNSFRASWLSGPEGEATRQAWFDEIDALVYNPRAPVRQP